MLIKYRKPTEITIEYNDTIQKPTINQIRINSLTIKSDNGEIDLGKNVQKEFNIEYFQGNGNWGRFKYSSQDQFKGENILVVINYSELEEEKVVNNAIDSIRLKYGTIRKADVFEGN